jgi:hypothetical protein
VPDPACGRFGWDFIKHEIGRGFHTRCQVWRRGDFRAKARSHSIHAKFDHRTTKNLPSV